MLRYLFAVAVLTLPAAPALADPDGMCELEEQGAKAPPCPSYITYDEDGEQVGTAAAGNSG